MLGRPRAAREVGWAMSNCPDELPWQRVVMADGSITGGECAAARRALLRDEGVPFLPDGRVDMEACAWDGAAGLIVHPWEPLCRANSKVLILGTIPSPKSREMGFYYGHPQNIFWKTLAEVLGAPEPPYDVDARRELALSHRVALWDVLHSCMIDGASDFSISRPVPNKFRPLLEKTEITRIFTTGKKATELFENLCEAEAGMPAIYLPSTSPANRATQKKPEFMIQWRQVADAISQ
jgi:hypoxanthine-DNA glycosylase